MSDTPLGRFCWYELLTHDPSGPPDFYQAVTGWSTQAWEGGENPYTMWMNGEAPVGGLMQMPEQAEAQQVPPHWLAYVSTPDIKATTTKAKELGATLHVDCMEIPEVGTISVIQDPQGAAICAYQPATYAPGHDGPAEAGEVSWHELATTDWEAAWAFYSELFGWQHDSDMDMGEMGTYRMFNRGAHALGGIFNKPAEMPVACWTVYVRVPDVAAAVEQVRAHGGQVLNGPMEVPGGDLVAQCLDPHGAMFALHETAA